MKKVMNDNTLNKILHTTYVNPPKQRQAFPDLPDVIKRWSPNKKAHLLRLLQINQIDREVAKEKYSIVEEELQSWEKLYTAHGLPGLRSKLLSSFRDTPKRAKFFNHKTKTTQVVHREGFWSESEKPPLLKESWLGKEVFLASLRIVERKAVPFDNNTILCAVCGQLSNGKEYEYYFWRWPDSLKHYIVMHHYKPSNDFITFIREKS